MVCFVTSAASAASAEVFISARYLYFLAKAGHAPAFLGAVWPKKPKGQHGAIDNRPVVPWVGVLITVVFSGLSWLCVRPGDNTMSEMEKVSKVWLSVILACQHEVTEMIPRRHLSKSKA